MKGLDYILIGHIFFFFGIHPLGMTTTSSSSLNVGHSVAGEANA